MALLIGAAAWVSRSLALVPGEVAAVWVSNGIFVGWLLSRPMQVWPGHIASGFAAEFLARWATGDLLTGAALSACDLIEVMIVAGAVRRLVPDVGNPRQWLALGGIATASTLLACAVAGALAAATVAATTGAAFVPTFMTWYSAHVVGMVIVATFTLVAHREGIGVIDVPGRRWHFAGSMLLLALVSGAVFAQSSYPLLFLAYPPLVWAVFQHRFAGVVVGVSLLAIIGSVATAFGYGPLVIIGKVSSDTERIVLLQLFIGTACLMAFPIALAMAERARLTSRLRESETRYRMLTDYSHDVVVRMRADGQRLFVSPSAKDVLGWEPHEMIGTRWGLVHPEDRERQQQVMRDVIASGEADTSVYRVRHKDGHYVWIEAVTRPIPSVDEPGVMDIICTGRDVSRRIAAEQALQESRLELEAMARIDSLTGLANRRQFDERLALALNRSQRQESAIALMYMDIDYFKQVNDHYGHAAGDEVLRSFGQRLAACVRVGDLVARLGGDEFVVLIEDASAPADAETVARKLIDIMAATIATGAANIRITTSIGIAFCAGPSTAQALMSAADGALYAAKEAGRDRWHLGVVEDAS